MISFSGIDCAGKTTQIELLEKYFRNHNIKYKRIWARGRCTPGVVLLKNIVRKDKNFDEQGKKKYREKIHKSTRNRRILLILSLLDLYWYFGIYYRFLNVIHKNLICDRYLWDTYIDFIVDYSEFDFEKWIIWRLLPKFVLKPRVSFLFVITPEESIQRGIAKKEAGMQTFAEKKKKIKEYLELVKSKKWTNTIDGSKNIEEMHSEVKKVLNFEN